MGLKILWFLGLGAGLLLVLAGLAAMSLAGFGGNPIPRVLVVPFIAGMALVVAAIATARHVFPDRWP